MKIITAYEYSLAQEWVVIVESNKNHILFKFTCVDLENDRWQYEKAYLPKWEFSFRPHKQMRIIKAPRWLEKMTQNALKRSDSYFDLVSVILDGVETILVNNC